MLRLWFDLFAPVASGGVGTLLAVLGAGGVLWGSLQAFRARRLKLLVAYSTLAQIGMMVMLLTLTGRDGVAAAWAGTVYLMFAHAAAKAAMFLACGRIAEIQGDDQIRSGRRGAPRPALAQFAFAMAAVSLIGLPPSGGFIGKWLLAEGAIRAQAWVWLAILAVGTALTAAYLFRALASFLDAGADRSAGGAAVPGPPVWALADGPPLVLALLSVALGIAATGPLEVLSIGQPFAERPPP